MDIIDLDQILDEFEAKEERHAPSTTTPAKSASYSPPISSGSSDRFNGSKQYESLDRVFEAQSMDFTPTLTFREENGESVRSKENGGDQQRRSIEPEPSLVDLSEPTSMISTPVLEPSTFWGTSSNQVSHVPLSPKMDNAVEERKSDEATPPNGNEVSPKARPPDVTNFASHNERDVVDQEPEDPKLSPLVESAPITMDSRISPEQQQPQQQQQNPPPDVVAGHMVVSRSGSSTPSPILDSKRPIIGFFSDGDGDTAQDQVTEDDLERYLNELEEKIGDQVTTSQSSEDKEESMKRATPSSDELKLYLENLEKLSGESIGIHPSDRNDVEVDRMESPMDEVVEGNLQNPTDLVKPSKDTTEKNPSTHVVEKDSTPKEEEEVQKPSSIPVTEEDDIVVDEPGNRSKFHPGVEMEDEDDADLEEDPYVTLAFTSPQAIGEESSGGGGDDKELHQNLKDEIEQALLAPHKMPECIVPAPDIEDTPTTNQSAVVEERSVIESSTDSFEDAQETLPVGSPSVDEQGQRSNEEEPPPLQQENDADRQQSSEVAMDANASTHGGTSTAIAETAQTSTEAAPPPSSATVPKGQLVMIRRINSSSPTSADAGGNESLKLTESELQLGRVPPVWIPDNDSSVCMLCELKFNVLRRRHHCRACGRVLCNDCCNQRAKLPYMASTTPQETAAVESGKKKEKEKARQDTRVCTSCAERLKRVDEYEQQQVATAPVGQQAENGQVTNVQASSTAQDSEAAPSTSSHTRAAAAAASSSGASSSPQPRPPVLKRATSVRRSEPKQVMFSDGIKPGGDLTETPPSSATTPLHSASSSSSVVSKSKSLSIGKGSSGKGGVRARELECFFTLPQATGQATTSDQPTEVIKWPPVLDENGDFTYLDDEGVEKLFTANEAERKSVVFILKRNLRVEVRLCDIDCCLHRTIWCFATDGLRNVSQDEILIAIERGTDSETAKSESIPPLDTFVYLNGLYEDALKGKPLSDLSYTVFGQSGIHPVDGTKGFFGSKDNAGFLHYRPTYQCLQNLCLPEQPFLIGVLIQKSEVSWAKVMPLRLLLRLGVEYRYYPYPLVSDRSRKTLFFETGHTIMNLLTDMRNFTYTLPSIPGCTVALEDDKTVISIPIDQYNQVLKILQSSNEHVLAWAASLHKSADAHLVCVQQPDTLTYTSQIINRENRERKLTGACFVVFNASLKAGGASSRISIVEDGVMVQIRPEAMERLRQSLHQQHPFELNPTVASTEGESTAEANTNVTIKWIPTAEKMSRFTIKSRVDGRNLTDAPRYRLHGKTVESTNGRKLIRLIELYLLRDGDEPGVATGEPEDLQSMVRQVALTCGTAMIPFAEILTEASMKTIAVRFAMGADLVEYSVGSNEQPLADVVMSAVDDVLIPLLHSRAMGGNGGGTGNDANRVWRVELVMRLLDL